MLMGTNHQGIWAGLIFGGTAIQTLILTLVTIRCDWEKEVHKNFSKTNFTCILMQSFACSQLIWSILSVFCWLTIAGREIKAAFE